MPTEKEIERLAEAMWQLLDDMSEGGLCVCAAAKAEARLAFEPFANMDRPACRDWMTVEQAEQTLRECDG